MNFKMIRPKIGTEGLLLSITKNCETLIKQTQTKPETLEIKLNKSRETFHFSPPISIEGSWMIDLLSLEVYNSMFNVTEENNKFEIYRDTFDEFSFDELKDELKEILSFNISFLIFQILHHHVYNMKKKDHALLKQKRK